MAITIAPKIKPRHSPAAQIKKGSLNPNDPAYQAAWQRFWEGSGQLRRFWRTKKACSKSCVKNGDSTGFGYVLY